MMANNNEILPWCGIYKVVNLDNGKRYIGQTTRTFHIRWKEEIREALYIRKKWVPNGYRLSKFAHELCKVADDPNSRYIKISDTEAQFGYLHFKKIQEWYNVLTKNELLSNESNTIKFHDSYNNGYNGTK